MRMDRSGMVVPYLAESYEISSDHKVWKFKFRQGLLSQSKHPLSALGYVEGLHELFRFYVKKHGTVAYFDKLKGFKGFADGAKSIPGLRNEGDFVIFEFDLAPEPYLDIYAIPTFGYFLESEFAGGAWRDNTTITSTGPMKLISYSENAVRLQSRPEWPLKGSLAHEIEIHSVTELPELSLRGQIIREAGDQLELPNGYIRVVGLPQWLVALVLNPTAIDIPRQLRRKIAETWLDYHSHQTINLPFSKSSPNFNFLDPISFDFAASSEIKDLSPTTLSASKIAIAQSFDLHPIEASFIDGLFAAIRASTGLHLHLEKLKDPDMQKLMNDQVAPGRLGRVIVGPNGHNSNNQIMFNTKLGIRFPDPSGRVRSLIRSYANLGKKIDQEYLDQFTRVLFEDGAVFPLLHRSNTYLVSDDFRTDWLPKDMDNAPLDVIGPHE